MPLELKKFGSRGAQSTKDLTNQAHVQKENFKIFGSWVNARLHLNWKLLNVTSKFKLQARCEVCLLHC
jgi:hypothetical protein